MNQIPDSANFYRQLPFLPDYSAVARAERFHRLPGDWALLASDIVNSTGHIAAGEYRNINLIGASCITAALNALPQGVEIPFFFGGDGAQLACPAVWSESVLQVWRGLAERARQAFGFQLRIGSFSVSDLQTKGFEIQVAKLRLTPQISQAVFSGNGLPELDRLLKSQRNMTDGDAPALEPDLTGLECRWKEIPGAKEEIISLLIQARPGHSATYQEALSNIQSMLGTKSERHPLRPDLMHLDNTLTGQKGELLLRRPGLSRTQRLLRQLYGVLRSTIGERILRLRLRSKEMDWGKYFDQVIEFSDCEKFNGMLSMVAACTRADRLKLEAYLEERYRAGILAYGVHVSESALMTCMVFDRHDRHIHFVDGANGGYAMAANDLKRRLLK